MNLFNPIALGYDERLKQADEAARDAAWSAEDMGNKVAEAALKAGDAANKAADLAAAEQAAADKAEILKSRQEDVARSAEDAAGAWKSTAVARPAERRGADGGGHEDRLRTGDDGCR